MVMLALHLSRHHYKNMADVILACDCGSKNEEKTAKSPTNYKLKKKVVRNEESSTQKDS